MEPATRGKTGLLIMLHGMGMSGKEFGDEFDRRGISHKLSWIELFCPDAPKRRISSAGGKQMRAWFDLLQSPVSFGMALPGLADEVARVHDMLREAERRGIPANRIILAGFSQGGVLALQAGLTYSRCLAGICTFSAWFPSTLKTANLAKYKEVPILMGHGELDSVVPFEVGISSYRMLKKKRMSHVSFSRYKNFKHWIKEEQFDQVESFALKEVPQFPKPIPVLLKPSSLCSSMSVGSTEEGSTSGLSDDDVFITDDERLVISASCPLPVQAPASLKSAPPTPDSKAYGRGLAPAIAHTPTRTDAYLTRHSVNQSTGCFSPSAAHRSVKQNAGSSCSTEAALTQSFFPLHASASSIGREAAGIGNFRFGGSVSNSSTAASSRCSMSPPRFHASRIGSNRSVTPIPPCGSHTTSMTVPTWRGCFAPA
jgi:phospholipase/carboxylesterase